METLRQQFNQHWQQLLETAGVATITAKQKFVLAFSGGVDSVSLLDLLMQLPQQSRPTLSLAYFNHQLRVDSSQEEQLVRQIAAHYQLSLTVGHWQHDQQTSEAAARQARYEFLAEALQTTGANYLITAHHGDDLVETILLKLIRSGELNELPGLKNRTTFRDWQLWRPLLPFSKQALRDYATQQQLTYIEDTTNQLDFTPRNRLRHHVIPELKQENPQLLAHTYNFAEELVAQQKLAHQFLGLWYEKMTLEQKSGQISGTFPPVELDLMGWQLFWQDFIRTYLPDLQMGDHQQLKQIAALTREPKGHHRVDLPNDWCFLQTYDHFTFKYFAPQTTTEYEPHHKESYALTLNQWCQIGSQSIGVFTTLPPDFEQATISRLQVTQIPQQLLLRHRLPGDRLQLSSGHRQKLSRRQIDLKVPFDQRDQAWVVVGDQEILWVQNIYDYKLSNVTETAKIIYVLLKN